MSLSSKNFRINKKYGLIYLSSVKIPTKTSKLTKAL